MVTQSDKGEGMNFSLIKLIEVDMCDSKVVRELYHATKEALDLVAHNPFMRWTAIEVDEEGDIMTISVFEVNESVV
jgi:hypothetical protein